MLARENNNVVTLNTEESLTAEQKRLMNEFYLIRNDGRFRGSYKALIGWVDRIDTHFRRHSSHYALKSTQP